MAKITTITNPLTGQPAQVDQLDHTAQQIDDGLNIARGVSNPNLLDNWYFGNQVDQRQGRVVKPSTTYYSDNTLVTAAGTTSAYVTAYRYTTGTASGVNYAAFKLTDTDAAPTYYAAPANVVRGYVGDGFGIDRMRGWGAGDVQLIKSDGVYFFGGWNSQAVETYLLKEGETYTLSVLAPNGLSGLSFYSDIVLDLIPNQVGGTGPLITHTFTIPTGFLDVPNGGIRAAMWGQENQPISGWKLELGSQQTLAHQDENGNWVLNEIPNYAEELAKCQWRQVIYRGALHYRFGVGFVMSSTSMSIMVPLPSCMASATPNVAISGDVRFVYSTESGYAVAVKAISKIDGCRLVGSVLAFDVYGDFSDMLGRTVMFLSNGTTVLTVDANV